MINREFISVFDILKIGVGPSSSHTLGPWRAAERFLKFISANGGLHLIEKIQVLLYGSLAKTGKGHGTDIAVLMGLSGFDPVTFDTSTLSQHVQQINQEKSLNLNGTQFIAFDPENDLKLDRKSTRLNSSHSQQSRMPSSA